jgi:hypothetical protein
MTRLYKITLYNLSKVQRIRIAVKINIGIKSRTRNKEKKQILGEKTF